MRILFIIFLLLVSSSSRAEDGYRLWLRYDRVDDPVLLTQYRNAVTALIFPTPSLTLTVARNELLDDLGSLLNKKPAVRNSLTDNCLLAGTPASSPEIARLLSNHPEVTGDGYILQTTRLEGMHLIVIAARSDIGVLYGVFAFLRLLQTHQSIHQLSLSSSPLIQRRILDHWDNLNRTIERGYAGASIWNWHLLPDYIDQRYIDYARANASIGINGTVLTNVNANSLVLTAPYLQKVRALADVFRPYGIRVYLTAKFSAPVDLGGLETADPLDPAVQKWWKDKCDEIYSLIPDFGGFLVKANSEGQPGPQTYGRTHTDGANMFADALAPHGGIVMWRAFVYDAGPELAAPDRFKQAYAEFTPFDGKFRSNVLIQVKNGPIDFQPREPFSPLFGGMSKTPLMMEFQITQEYLGQGTHLVYEAPLFKEALDADTYANGKGSTVARIIDGSAFHSGSAQSPTLPPLTGMAGVSNIGNERNWTNHPFGQANWYAFGRLAWDHTLSPQQIAGEWIRQTFSNNAAVIHTIEKIMMASREAVVNYMTPLGLHHIMATGHHYGPGPWSNNASRADWNPVYYHRADAYGIGFDRTATGSNALAQYQPPVRQQWLDSNTCDEKFLLWFHHMAWSHKMKDGRTLWEELCTRYQQGVDTVKWMQQEWQSLSGLIDKERFNQVGMLLHIQEKDAEWWRNACILYFQTFSQMPIPPGVGKPGQTLEYYKSLRFPYAPGTGGSL
ncbi:MAG TPA: alpha-glucuronidase family glycosyl hydrolase [Puia sp.]|nr:alpha-glucuronidase family glycosyl hydrolase [Puia sp.]